MISYKKGAFLNICTDSLHDWEVAFRQVESLVGKDHLELWVEHLPSGSARTSLRNMLQGLDLVVHGPFIHLSLVSHVKSINEQSVRRFHEAVDLASQLGAKVVTFHAGTFPVFWAQDRALEELAERFSPFAKIAAPIITLENMPVRRGTAIECLGKLEDLERFEALVPEARFTLDIGHCLQNGDDFESFLKRKSHKIEDIHLHDGVCGGRAHMPLGAGKLDLCRLLKTFSDVKFDGYVGLETISWADTTRSWASWSEVEQGVKRLLA
jgi:sugar phosphate isomerase/epimerase